MLTRFLRHIPLLQAIRTKLADPSRRLFDPFSIASYSQSGEDRILAYYLGSTGFYVDVGCNHPQMYSNTFAFYRRGWSGITIDANPSLIRLHQAIRPRDRAICAAVSDATRQIDFVEFEDSLVSSLDASHIEKWTQHRRVRRVRPVLPRTLTDILNECQAPKTFDLLSIDVERHDLQALRSLDLSLYRPRLIVIEMHDFEIEKPNDNPVLSYLRSHGYRLIAYATMNGYFLDTSQPLPSPA